MYGSDVEFKDVRDMNEENPAESLKKKIMKTVASTTASNATNSFRPPSTIKRRMYRLPMSNAPLWFDIVYVTQFTRLYRIGVISCDRIPALK